MAGKNWLSPLLLLVQLFSLPLIFYAVFFSIRLFGVQPEAEAGMGEFITALYFLFGASICYLVFVVCRIRHDPLRSAAWWWSIGAFLALLALDEIYMIHENVSLLLGVQDIAVFLAYGTVLTAMLWLRRAQLEAPSLSFLGLFLFFGTAALIGDTFGGKGEVILFGRNFSYEQLAESLGALVLSCAFVPLALSELRTLLPSGSPGAEGKA